MGHGHYRRRIVRRLYIEVECLQRRKTEKSGTDQIFEKPNIRGPFQYSMDGKLNETSKRQKIYINLKNLLVNSMINVFYEP